MKTKALARICLTTLCLFLATTACFAEQVRLEVALATPAVLADQKQTAYLRVAMTGLPLPDEKARPEVNLALVLDRSGSMQGQKIERAKEAAIMALDRLGPNDIVSVVAYGSYVDVLIPATRLADRESIYASIRGLTANESTALFAGVSKGAQEVRKFFSKDRINRIILLSDGLANVGPSSPGALADLGLSLGREGISVTTLGLGLDYNEDLMTALAQKSDGNHRFIENSEDLRLAFATELGDVVSVVAQDVSLKVNCMESIRPVRTIGRSGDIAGQTVTTSLNQIYADQMKYLIVELEVPPRPEGIVMPVATVELAYADMHTNNMTRISGEAKVAYTASADRVKQETNNDVMVSVVQQIGAENNRLAMRLRDEGKLEEGKRVLEENVAYLNSNAIVLNSPALIRDGKDNGSLVVQWQGSPRESQGLRKNMRDYQHRTMNQQAGPTQK